MFTEEEIKAAIQMRDDIIKSNNIDVSHLRSRDIKYPVITKICPICENSFETKSGCKEERTTCSYSCSNTFFRSGINNPNFGKKWPEQSKLKHEMFSKKYIVEGQEYLGLSEVMIKYNLKSKPFLRKISNASIKY